MSLELSVAKHEAQQRKRQFRNVLTAGLIYHALLAFALILCTPDFLATLLHSPNTGKSGYAIVGLLVLMTTLYRATGAFDAFRWRWPNIIAIVQHVVLGVGLIFAGGRLPVFGVIELLFTLATAYLFLIYAKAEVMSRP
jgi:hypothetical protein